MATSLSFGRVNSANKKPNYYAILCIHITQKAILISCIFNVYIFYVVGAQHHPGLLYGKSESGWMTSEVFFEWFQAFCENVTQRPLLLLLDGHLSHVSIEVIELAIKENVIILKFPAHVTNVLQSLDASCFGPLKKKWSALLNMRSGFSGARRALTKAEFVDELASMWFDCLTTANVKSGFNSTGIYPVDQNQYPRERFNKRLLAQYKKWECRTTGRR